MIAPIAPSVRRTALAVVLIAQTLMFLVFLPRPLQVISDNVRYETAGYNLSRGEGLSLPYELQPDVDVRAWTCPRHPLWCKGDDVPTAMYPPGYEVYIASIYFMTGRNLGALFVSQLVLLLAMFFVFEKLATRYTNRVGYFFVMTIAATYPFVARQAAYVMSDHLHAALILFALALVLTRRAGLWRGLCSGLLLGAATLTRPYSFVCLPFVAIALALRTSTTSRSRHQDLIGYVIGAGIPFAVWIVRNAIVFGRFIPFGTTGLGVSLYYNKLAWTIGSIYDVNNAQAVFAEIERVAGGDPFTWHANRVLQSAALEWMRENPWKLAASLPVRTVRVWISLGTSGEGISRIWPLLATYLGGLLALGVGGIWAGRRRPEVVLIAMLVIPYWAFLMHAPAEARRTLPLRLPMLLCAGIAIDALVMTFGARFASFWSRLGSRQ
jgi:4-amino-4-deoxy-L-arabinose transferase-like glycosyltransferase